MSSSALWLPKGSTARGQIEIDVRGFVLCLAQEVGWLVLPHNSLRLLSKDWTPLHSLGFWAPVSTPSPQLSAYRLTSSCYQPWVTLLSLAVPSTHIFVNSPVVNKPSSNYTVCKVPSVSCWDHG